MNEITPAEHKKGFHPKAVLKNAQQRVYNSRYLYLIFCFFVPVILSYLMYVSRGIFPFYNGSPLILDLNSQYVSFFEALREVVWGDNSLLYSFARSLGGEFMGIYAYYLASPLSYIVALFPAERIQEAILLLLLIKTGLSGLTFGYFLDRHTRTPNRLHIFVFSLMYSLSSFAVVHHNNTMWIDALILLPLFCLGLEVLVLQKKFKLYVITLSAILICNYYIGYMVCIFAVIYFCYCYFSRSEAERNPYGERLHFVRTGARFALFSILSAAISAFMLFAAYYSLGFGKSGFSTPDWSIIGNFEITDFLTKILPGAYDTVEPTGMPFIYCGLLALFMLPVYFCAKRISVREKLASLGVLTIFVLSFFTNPIDLIWHGFSMPNWLNARYSFLFIFFVLILAYKGLGNLGSISEKFVLLVGAFIVLFAAVAQKLEIEAYLTSKEKLLTYGCIWFSIFFAVGLAALLCAYIKIPAESHTHKSISAVIAAVVCTELLCNGIVCTVQLNRDVGSASYSEYVEHFGELRPAVEALRNYDSGFYRFEKTNHRTKNDNMALGINGITSSTSTLNADAIDLVNRMGYTGRAHLTMYQGGTPFSDSFFGIKYVVDYSVSDRYTSLYNELTELGNQRYKIMQNPYALSLAFGTSSDIKKFDALEDSTFIKRYSFFSRFNKMAGLMLGESKDIPMFVPVKNMKSQYRDCTLSESFVTNTYTTKETQTGDISYTYTAPYSGNYYFYLPLSTDMISPSFSVKVSGGYSGEYLTNDTNNILNVGYFEEGSQITITFSLPKDAKVSIKNTETYLWYLDNEVYEDTMTSLLAMPQMSFDEQTTDEHIVGKINTTQSNQMILTTIPYDEGWNVYIDGEKAEIYQALGALMAFDIDTSGEHTVEFKYFPKCYTVGLAISGFGLLVFIALCAVEYLLKRTRAQSCASLFHEEASSFLWYFDGDELPYVKNVDISYDDRPDDNTNNN